MDIYTFMAITFTCIVITNEHNSHYAVEISVHKRYVHVIQKNSVIFDCPIKSIKGFWWNYEGSLLYAEDNAVNSNFVCKSKLLHNYSLYLTATFLCYDGSFECRNNSSTISSYFLEVIVETCNRPW